MSSTDDLCTRPATELAAMVRAGEVSARELVDAHLDRIDRLNPDLNAIVTLDAEGARARTPATTSPTARPVRTTTATATRPTATATAPRCRARTRT